MKLSAPCALLTLLTLLAGATPLHAAETMTESASPVANSKEIDIVTAVEEHKPPIEFSKAASASVRALENFTKGTQSRDREARLAYFIAALQDDPGAKLPINFIRGMIVTRTDARNAADALVKLASSHPGELPIVALAAQIAYGGNLPTEQYLSLLRKTLDGAVEPTRMEEETLADYYNVAAVYASALKQSRQYAEGSKWFAAMLDRDASEFRSQMLKFALNYEYFFLRSGNRERGGLLGLGSDDRTKAAERFDRLFTEYQAEVSANPVGRNVDQDISFYHSIGKSREAYALAEKAAEAEPIPAHLVRLAYSGIEAKMFDRIPGIVENLKGTQGWWNAAQVLWVNTLIAQEKYDEALAAAEEFRIPMARDEYKLKVFEARKDYAAMRDLLNEMETRLSPGVEIDLANAMRQIVVAEKLRDTELLNRLWKLLADTDQIDSSDVSNAVGYVAAELNIRLDEAKELITEALKWEPYNYAFLDSMGWVLFRLGRAEEALEYIDRAVRESEQELSRGVIFEHKGDILASLKRKKEAVAAYRAALDYPEDDDFDPEQVRVKLQELE